MRPGCAADHSSPSSAAVMEDLYPPSGPHRACNGITLPFYALEMASFNNLIRRQVKAMIDVLNQCYSIDARLFL